MPAAKSTRRPSRVRHVSERFASMFFALAATRLFGAFGYTASGSGYVVDTGAGLVFTVNKANGDITSIVFDGTEYRGPSGKGSQIASGLGSATVSIDSDNTSYIKVTIQTDASNPVVSDFTHYLVVRNGINTIYMATYPTAEPAVGELRWITRLTASLMPNGPAPSDTGGGTAIESKDVFGLPDGTTRSKYYGNAVSRGKERAMDLTYCGATGPGVGCWMVFGNRESSSGGPFYRDIENQWGGTVNTSDQEIYNYMNSGHEQTEPPRLNVLHGPYALVFTTGGPPSLPVDFAWMGELGLKGWVPASGRGSVTGAVSGIPDGFQAVVALSNGTAQYWALAPGGRYTCGGVKPGDYDVTLYKGELAVATAAVTVSAGATATVNLTSDEPTPSYIFRIGEWDGTPAGMLNADKIVQMHPSDSRMAPWGPVTFTVGSSPASSFPAIQMRGENSPTTIKFTLGANQLVDLTLRIGVTCAYGNGRPQVNVNSWASSVPAASAQPNSRSFTVGTWRGNNALYTFTIPASALVVGTNTMMITPASGAADLGPWLSAGWVYDAVELDGPGPVPDPPAGLTATMTTGDQVRLQWTAANGATGYTIRRAEAGGGPFATVAADVSGTQFTDDGLSGGITYYYTVSSGSGGGESAATTPVGATTRRAEPGKLTNLSVRATAGDDAETLITGFALGGSKPILVRGVGPTLEEFNVPNALADPTLTLRAADGTVVDANDDWGGGTALRDLFDAVGAFALPGDSKDAALVHALTPGTYTAAVAAKSASGAAIAEIYDADSAGDGRLINVSARAEVSAADNLIAGFFISGNVQKTVLIRAVGPGLADFGVNGVLSHPTLALYRQDQTLICTDRDWSTSSSAADFVAAARSVGAFELADGSADAVLLVKLPAGGYSAEVTSGDGESGVALIEAYEVP